LGGRAAEKVTRIDGKPSNQSKETFMNIARSEHASALICDVRRRTPRRSRLRCVLLGTIVAVTAILNADAARAQSPCDSANTGYNIGQTAPNFTLVDSHGATVRLRDYCGQAVVLSSVAEWCAPCQQIAQQIASEVASYGCHFTFIDLISQNTSLANPTQADLQLWATTYNLGTPQTPVLADPNYAAMGPYGGTTSWPTNVLLDKNQVIVDIHIGSPIFPSSEITPLLPPGPCKNGCSITNNPTRGLAIDGPGYPTSTALNTLAIDYEEPVPFLTAQPTDFSMAVSVAPQPGTAVNPNLLGPGFHTMGANEGPGQLSQVGDGGHITINYGPCGTIDDDFSVTGILPYHLSHSIYGALHLGAFGNVGVTDSLFRDVVTNFTATGATGTVQLGDATTGAVLCTGGLTVTYTAAHPTVTLPAQYHSHLVFNGTDSTGALVGTRIRVQAGVGVPAMPARTFIAAFLAMLLAGAALLYKSRQGDGRRSRDW
jgi:peroxiredoxin